MKRKKTYRKIGKKEYEFDYTEEKIIYAYFCLNKLSKREEKVIKRLQDANKISGNKYSDWRGYIYKKYEEYDIEQLENFAHYVQQGIRNNEVIKAYNSITQPVMVTFFLTIAFERIIDSLVNYTGNTISDLIIQIILIGVFICMVNCVAWMVITTVTDDSMEKNMYSDYFYIIKDMIKRKKHDVHVDPDMISK